jgi:hypothetical protein
MKTIVLNLLEKLKRPGMDIVVLAFFFSRRMLFIPVETIYVRNDLHTPRVIVDINPNMKLNLLWGDTKKIHPKTLVPHQSLLNLNQCPALACG